MGLINIRDILQWPQNGNNMSDSVINGVHFNTSALNHWNYTLYSNNTLSNGTNCYLIFGQFQPALIFSNGTFVNTTKCDAPVNPIEGRGKLGAVFGTLFGLSLVFTLINLHKHGQQFLIESKRFTIVGRRWQWYWLIVLGACGMISSITGIDVDRNYLQSTSLILQSLFYYCMGLTAIAAIWEGVRHWGSWQERKFVDENPFDLLEDDTRGKIEFWMPIAFYTFTFMSFFMVIPRSWTNITDQGGYIQQNTIAKPIATDGRFKAGAILLIISWLITWYCVRHNLKYYRTGNRVAKFFTDFPYQYTLCLFAMGIFIGYTAASVWNFNLSIIKYDVAIFWPYVFGYGPCLFICVLLNIWGLRQKNEDKEIIRLRIERGQTADDIIGVTRKPNWWSKATGGQHLDELTRLRGMIADENVHTVKTGGDKGLELDDMSNRGPQAFSDGIRDSSRSSSSTRSPDGNRNRNRLSPLSSNGRSLNRASSSYSITSTMTGNTVTAEPQKVRSMLDI